MRVVIQRVREASVSIGGRVHAVTGQGMLILLGMEQADEEGDVLWLCAKIPKLRIFNDDAGVMNLSLEDIRGEVLVVSQFTLHAGTKKGNRPSYIRAARPEKAQKLYDKFIETLAPMLQKPVRTGVFGADMQVMLVNDGPVTILMDSRLRE